MFTFNFVTKMFAFNFATKDVPFSTIFVLKAKDKEVSKKKKERVSRKEMLSKGWDKCEFLAAPRQPAAAAEFVKSS